MKNDNSIFEVGSYWICKSKFNLDIVSTDILAKIIHVSDTHVRILRKIKYGYEDITPASMTFDDFIQFYDRLED